MHVTRGEVFDVAVDIRRGSPTFGQWFGTMLSADNHRQMWIPPGFAHGFLVTSDHADSSYKVTANYAPADERGIAWNDPRARDRVAARRRPDAVGAGWRGAAPRATPSCRSSGHEDPRHRRARTARAQRSLRARTATVTTSSAPDVDELDICDPDATSRASPAHDARDQRRRVHRRRQGGDRARHARSRSIATAPATARARVRGARHSAAPRLDRLRVRRHAARGRIARTIRIAPLGVYGESKAAGEAGRARGGRHGRAHVVAVRRRAARASSTRCCGSRRSGPCCASSPTSTAARPMPTISPMRCSRSPRRPLGRAPITSATPARRRGTRSRPRSSPRRARARAHRVRANRCDHHGRVPDAGEAARVLGPRHHSNPGARHRAAARGSLASLRVVAHALEH